MIVTPPRPDSCTDTAPRSFQAYTTCTVLLHAVLQQQLHGDSRESVAVNLQRAQSCLAILEHCGSADSIISQMHSQLATLFRCAGGLDSPPRPPGHAPPPLVFLPPDYLLTLPEALAGDAALERVRLSKNLLVRLCGPFEDMDQCGMPEAHMIPGLPARIGE